MVSSSSFQVYVRQDRGSYLLKSHVDGHVMITQEEIHPDLSLPENAPYLSRVGTPIYKLTFNVIPLPMSNTFHLVNEI